MTIPKLPSAEELAKSICREEVCFRFDPGDCPDCGRFVRTIRADRRVVLDAAAEISKRALKPSWQRRDPYSNGWDAACREIEVEICKLIEAIS